jgi:hypothetical protein
MFRVMVAGVLCCGALPALAGAENLKRNEGVALEGVGVVNGELRVVKERASGWRFRTTPRGVLIYLAAGEKIGAWGGWYLNYDHRGKDPRVGLVSEPGPGCYWTWSEGGWKKNRGGYGYTFPCTARPANGPLRGWSLTFDGAKLVLAKEPAAPVTFTGSIDDLDDGK